MLPVSLENITNNYELDTFIFTNNKVKSEGFESIYNCNEKFIYFF